MSKIIKTSKVDDTILANMAERWNNYNLLPFDLEKAKIGEINKLHPTLDGPIALINPISLAILLQPENITPTGHRTISLPTDKDDSAKIVAKGFFPSPVQVYGEKAKKRTGTLNAFLC